ncbi:hypothetical protein AC481_01610 [miscellaneous Crenarchaeota group archaeon SMTZ-80]|nr:MAG: hypothetical protein AC481_01610 [miscellaneous Crenarchaeota group archaeon SMTZ-80]
MFQYKAGDTVLLYGKLGSGKTFLVREYVNLLGITDQVSSPSFSLVNQYHGELIINHIDLYRISDPSELDNLGLDDFWEMYSINFIEWPQLIEERIIWPHFRLYIDTEFRKKSWRRFRLIYL